MKQHGVTQAALASAIGLTSQSAVSNILKGMRQVKVDEARQIYAFLQIKRPDEKQIVSVPIIGITSAGNWREAIKMSVGTMPVVQGVCGPRSFALEVSGNSMNLLIEDGGVVIIDPDRKELQPGKCYLIQNGDHEATVKMYERSPARFVPCSSEPGHREFMVADADFAVIGRVVWKGAPV